jgi:hypothetical protein
VNQNEKLQAVFHLYQTEHGHAPARTRDAVEWAVNKNLLTLPKTDPFAALARQMATALAQEYDVYKGLRYRVNHAVRKKTPTGKQYSFWGILGHSPDDHVEMALGQQREQVVGQLAQMATDARVNNVVMAGKRPPYVLKLDFTEDMAERGLLFDS